MTAPSEEDSAIKQPQAAVATAELSKAPAPAQIDSKMLIADGFRHHQAGEFHEAARLYDRVLEYDSANLQLLYLRGLIAIELQDYQKAVDLLSLAISLNFRDPILHDSLGTALLGQGKLDAALERYDIALRLNPKSVNTLYNKGCALLLQEKEREAIVELNKVVKIDPTFYQAYGKLADAHANCNEALCERFFIKLFTYYMPEELEAQDVDGQDLFFVNAKLAMETALKNNQIQQTVYVKAPQICYCLGVPQEDDPENLIRVPIKDMLSYFHNSILRFPEAVQFDVLNSDEVIAGFSIATLLDKVQMINRAKVGKYYMLSREQKPTIVPGEPLRFFLAASRKTVVMQYGSRYLASALRRQGCEVKLVVEDNDYQDFPLHYKLEVCYKFNPHAVININYRNNSWLHPDIYNFIWWQDFMPDLIDGEPVEWRPRDVVLTADPCLIPYLEKIGAKDVQRQEFCVDLQLYQNRTPMAERNKAIFIGVAYTHRLKRYVGEAEIINAIQELLGRGEPVTMDFLRKIAEQNSLPLSYVYDTGPLFTHAIRETAVKWLCELAPHIDLDVEIYGRGWEYHPVISQYFKGEVANGPDVAALYNQAKYALSASPYVVDSQRLSEIAACGAIPVMYDARPFAEKPHWDDECLWFDSKESFNACFERQPVNDPITIAKTNSYDAFAQRIMQLVKL